MKQLVKDFVDFFGVVNMQLEVYCLIGGMIIMVGLVIVQDEQVWFLENCIMYIGFVVVMREQNLELYFFWI